MKLGPKPLTIDGPFDLVAYTDKGVATHFEPPMDNMATETVCYAASGKRGAVVHDRTLRCYLVFDLRTATHIPMTIHHWWMFLGKSRAIAHALWFLRD